MAEPLESLMRCQGKSCNKLRKVLKKYTFKLETVMVNGASGLKIIPAIEKEVYVCSMVCADKEFARATKNFWRGEYKVKEKSNGTSIGADIE